MLTTSGVISGPLHSTTCLPLFTSTVVQVGWTSVVVVVEGAGEVILKVAVSGRTSSAWARVSTQNWHSTSMISWPVTRIPGDWVVATPGTCVPTTCVPIPPALTAAVSRPGVVVTAGVMIPVPVAVGVVPTVSVGLNCVLVLPGRSVPTIVVGVVPCPAPQAVVSSTRSRARHSKVLEYFIITLS
jgi:hypothetical protein